MNTQERFELCEHDPHGNIVFSRTFGALETAQNVARFIHIGEYHGNISVSSTTTGEVYAEYPARYELYELDLSVRAQHILLRAGITTKEQLLDLSANDLRQMRNMGSRSIAEIMRKIADLVDPCNNEVTLR